MDFALVAFRWFSRTHLAAGDPTSAWQRLSRLFEPTLRFRPAWVCAGCNEGDGWGKTLDWYGVPGRVYPTTFSMTLPELQLMRVSPRGKVRLMTAERIWRANELDHLERRRRIWDLARELSAS